LSWCSCLRISPSYGHFSPPPITLSPKQHPAPHCGAGYTAHAQRVDACCSGCSSQPGHHSRSFVACAVSFAFCLLCCRVDDCRRLRVVSMSLCCRVKHLHHVAVLQGQTPPPCRCAAGSNTSTMSLCCMVKHLHHVAVLQGQTPPPCRCAAGSNTSTMSLCCRVDDDCSPLLCCRVSEPFFPSYAPPVLQGGGQSLCCRVDDSLCCRVDPFLCLHLFPFCLLCCRVDDCRRLRVVSMSLCCRVDDACPLERNFLPVLQGRRFSVLQGRRFSVLQGRRFSVLQGQHTIICAAGSTHSCAAGSRGFRSML
jgi:hypothetical protein